MSRFACSIYGFKKTEHFLLRQWERKIDDELLLNLLQKIPPREDGLFVFSRQYFRRNSLFQTEVELFIKVKGSILITCFFNSVTEYVFTKKRECFKVVC